MGRKEIFADKKKADAAVKEYETGNHTPIELATAFDCSLPTIYKLFKSRGVKMRRGKKSEFTDEERMKIVKEYNSDKPTREIAEMADCSAPTINRILVEEGVKIRPRGRRKGSGKPKVEMAIKIDLKKKLKDPTKLLKVVIHKDKPKRKANGSKLAEVKPKANRSKRDKNIASGAAVKVLKRAKAARRPTPGKPRPARPKRKAKVRARKA